MTLATLILVFLFVLCTTALAIASYAYGYNNGLTARKTLLKAFGDSIRTNIKAVEFSDRMMTDKDGLYGEGDTPDAEPDDFERLKKERTVNDGRGFFA